MTDTQQPTGKKMILSDNGIVRLEHVDDGDPSFYVRFQFCWLDLVLVLLVAFLVGRCTA